MKLIILSFALVLLCSCSDGKYSDVPSSELAEKKRHCDSVKKKSAVFAAGCEGVTKEIERRKEERKKRKKK